MDRRPRLSPARKTLASSGGIEPHEQTSLCTLGKSPKTWARGSRSQLSGSTARGSHRRELNLIVSHRYTPLAGQSFPPQYTHECGPTAGTVIERLCANRRADGTGKAGLGRGGHRRPQRLAQPLHNVTFSHRPPVRCAGATACPAIVATRDTTLSMARRAMFSRGSPRPIEADNLAFGKHRTHAADVTVGSPGTRQVGHLLLKYLGGRRYQKAPRAGGALVVHGELGHAAHF